MALKRIIISFFISFLIFLHMILFFAGLFLIFKISVTRDIINSFFVVLVFLHKSVFYFRKYGFLRTKKSRAKISHNRWDRAGGSLYTTKKPHNTCGKEEKCSELFYIRHKKSPAQYFLFPAKAVFMPLYIQQKSPRINTGALICLYPFLSIFRHRRHSAAHRHLRVFFRNIGNQGFSRKHKSCY